MSELLFETEDTGGMIREAEISECGKYRYSLTRVWTPGEPMVCWIMLNPSTADHRQDDPTIRRCVDFSKRWGYGGLVVVNLYAFRATDPKHMLAAADPIGAECDRLIVKWATMESHAFIAWGTLGERAGRGRTVVDLLRRHGVSLQCLGRCRNGEPKHPLYVKGDTKPRTF